MNDNTTGRIRAILEYDRKQVCLAATQDFEDSVIGRTPHPLYIEHRVEPQNYPRVANPTPGEMDKLVAESETHRERLESIA